ncbi:MAG TPA: signal recognition particle protein [Fibrobacteres bacterium]|jgi:signal recognition particle subunit SRP54|nr:signal recognition particle protein [Fibrobacterota bacterium]
MFEQLTGKLDAAFKKLRGQHKLTEENISESLREIRVALLSADVHFQTVKDFIASVKTKALGADVLQSVSPGQMIVKILHDEMVGLLGGEAEEPRFQGSPPVGILMMGLQGSGKTTACGKLALNLRDKWNRKPMLVACDVYRPAAIEQLKILGNQINIPVYDEGPGDPVRIAENGRKAAKEQNCDVVIFDTAGRLQIDDALMLELEKIQNAVKPTERFFVADAMTGQEAVNVAKTFNDRMDFTGVLLTKMDGDARGGAALSIKSVTGKPIRYIGTGEKLDALELFHPDRMASRILGMGDVLTLVEKAQEVYDAKEAKQLEKKFKQNKFDLDDFLNQLRQVKKMGSMADLVSMIPGMSRLKDAKIDENQFKHVEAILTSMTPKERQNPKIIDGRRRHRIALGSGTSLQEVNQILRQFEQMQKMMKQMTGMASKMGGMKKLQQMMQQRGGGMGGFGGGFR